MTHEQKAQAARREADADGMVPSAVDGVERGSCEHMGNHIGNRRPGDKLGGNRDNLSGPQAEPRGTGGRGG